MNKTDILSIFEQAEAILRGHFILSSGLHADTYIQCARVLMHPEKSALLCAELAKKVTAEFGEGAIDMVVAPAMGGVVVGYEMGRQLSVPTIFCERVDGSFTLRRGFTIEKGQNILVVEDVVTTGKSSNEAIDCIRHYGGNVIGEACLINRSGAENPLDIPLISLLDLIIESYAEENLPPELAAIPAVKPGSRWIK